jgi:hypothetical protein
MDNYTKDLKKSLILYQFQLLITKILLKEYLGRIPYTQH